MLHGLAAELRQGAASIWLAEFLPAAVYVYDLERRRSVFLNQFASQLLGYCRDEIMTFETDFLGRALHPDDASVVAAHLERIDRLEDGVTACVEYRLRHRDGSWRWFLGHDTVLSRDGRGRVRQVLGIAADITERHRAEQVLRENEAAERSGRLRAERVTELMTGLGSVEGSRLRLKRLVEFLTTELADRASVEIPGSPGLCLATSDRSPRVCDGPDPETRSRLDVPVDLGQGVRGVLVLRILDPNREPFSPNDEAFVREIADCAGLVLTKASLREEEHRTSLRLQRALLPDTLRVHPDVVIDAHYEAASTLLEVGGDWYDSYSWPQGQLGVMVGDVMGHDLAAAVAMGRLRAGVGALVTQGQPRASEVLEALDRCASGPDGTEFVTACAVVIDPRDGQLRYSRAGHPPVLLVPPAGEPVWLDDAASVPVSGLTDGRRPEVVLRIEPGSVVILFSDGLVERRGESLVQGLVRLRRAAVRLVRSGEPDLASQLAAALAEESVPEDDVVVVTVRYRPDRGGALSEPPGRSG